MTLYKSADYSSEMRNAVLFQQAAPGDDPIPNTAEDYRTLVDGIFLTSGVVALSTALKVAQLDAGPNTLLVQISPGAVVLPSTYSGGGKYIARLLSTFQVSLPAAPGSGTQIHRIVAYATDKADNSPSGTTDYGWAIETLSGSVGGGAPSTPSGRISLATISRTAGVTSIADSAITDTRPVASTVGATAVDTSVYGPPGGVGGVTQIWNKPFGAKSVWVRVSGGGGGGGGVKSAASGQAAGGGGGGGAYSEEWYSASSLPSSVGLIVGIGGSGGAGATPSSGSTGGLSCFGTVAYNGTVYIQSLGGAGGSSDTATTSNTYAPGGNGAAQPTTGKLNIAGGDGGTGRCISGATTDGGYGGVSVLGGSQRPSSQFSTVTAPAGQPFGGGGAGAVVSTTSKNGGAGAEGVVIVTTYF